MALDTAEFTNVFMQAFKKISLIDLPPLADVLIETYSQIDDKAEESVISYIAKAQKETNSEVAQYYDSVYKHKYAEAWPLNFKDDVRKFIKKNEQLTLEEVIKQLNAEMHLENLQLYCYKDMHDYIEECYQRYQSNKTEPIERLEKEEDKKAEPKHEIEEEELSNEECLELMVKDINSIKQIFQINHPLLLAMKKNNVTVVQQHALSSERCVFYNYLTPLHIAVFLNKIEEVKLLIRKYCRIHYQECYTALSVAILLNHKDIFDLLLPYEHSCLSLSEHELYNFIPVKTTAFYFSQFESDLYYLYRLMPLEYIISNYNTEDIENEIWSYYDEYVKEILPLNKLLAKSPQDIIAQSFFNRGFEVITHLRDDKYNYLEEYLLSLKSKCSVDTVMILLSSEFRILSMKQLSSLSLAVLLFDVKSVKLIAEAEAGTANFGGIYNDFKIPKKSTALDLAQGIEELYENQDYENFDAFIEGSIDETVRSEKYNEICEICQFLETTEDQLVDISFCKPNEVEKLIQNGNKFNKFSEKLIYEDELYQLEEENTYQTQYIELLDEYISENQIEPFKKNSSTNGGESKATEIFESQSKKKKVRKNIELKSDELSPATNEEKETVSTESVIKQGEKELRENALAEIEFQVDTGPISAEAEILHTNIESETFATDFAQEMDFLVEKIAQSELNVNKPELIEPKQKHDIMCREIELLEQYAKEEEDEIGCLQQLLDSIKVKATQ